jgi:predicted nucleotidyltransferase
MTPGKSLRRIDIGSSAQIPEKLRKFAARLRKRYRLKAIYLFGSCARGAFHEGSDIDLVIVGDFKERFFDRIGSVMDLTDLPIEPLVYTPDEFAQMLKNGNPLMEEVVRHGIAL